MKETEVKFFVKNFNTIRPKLKKMGGRLIWKGTEESWFFDTHKNTLKRKGQMLRIKKLANHGFTLTFKNAAKKNDKKYKSREEKEVTINNSETARNIFKNIGFKEVFKYTKLREHWDLGKAHIELDKLKNKYIVEIESSKKEIGRIAKLLGLDWAKSTTETYIRILKESKK